MATQQHNSVPQSGNAAAPTYALTGVSVGDWIVVGAVNFTAGGAASVTVGDNAGNNYLGGPGTGGSVAQVVQGQVRTSQWMAEVTSAPSGNLTVQLTFGAASDYSFNVQRWSGILSGASIDKAATITATGTQTSLTVGPTATLAQADEVVFTTFGAATGSSASGITAPSGYTGDAFEQNSSAFIGMGTAHKVVASTSAVSAAWTFGATAGTSDLCAVIGTLKITGAGGPTITSTSSATPQRGSTFTVTGSSFGASQGTQVLKIGGVTQTVTSWAAGSITITNLDIGTNKYGTAVNAEIWDGGSLVSNSFALTSLQPPTDNSFKDIVTPAASGPTRITTSPVDVASGDQIEATLASQVTLFDDATFSAGGTVQFFQARAWTSSGGGWGDWTNQVLIDLKASKSQFDPSLLLKGWF